MISRRILQIFSKYYGGKKDEKLETVDLNFPLLILLPQNFVTQNINVHYIFYAKKTLVNPTDSTYPKSTLHNCFYFPNCFFRMFSFFYIKVF